MGSQISNLALSGSALKYNSISGALAYSYPLVGSHCVTIRVSNSCTLAWATSARSRCGQLWPLLIEHRPCGSRNHKFFKRIVLLRGGHRNVVLPIILCVTGTDTHQSQKICVHHSGKRFNRSIHRRSLPKDRRNLKVFLQRRFQSNFLSQYTDCVSLFNSVIHFLRSFHNHLEDDGWKCLETDTAFSRLCR